MITSTSVSNFKSVMKIEDLKLAPLTLLTGVNSSGKSNVLEAISFFGQAARLGGNIDNATLRNIYSAGDIKTYPPDQLRDFVVFKKDQNSNITLEINVDADEAINAEIKNHFANLSYDNKEIIQGRKYVFPDEKNSIGSLGYRLVLDPPNSSQQSILMNNRTLLEVGSIRGRRSKLIYPKEFQNIGIARYNANVFFRDEIFRPTQSPNVLNIVIEVALLALKYIRERSRNIYFISGERVKLPATFKLSEHRESTPPTWVGVNGQHLMEILSHCLTREPEKAKKIKKWAEKFQIQDLRAGYILGRKNVLESNFKDADLDIHLNSALTGLGSGQILSIITQIFWSEPESVIMIEEPEISLHPQNQVLLHELFADAISQGKQIVCSTHSPFFVLALSRVIKRNLLSLKDIAVYHVEKDAKGTHLKSLVLNKHGFIQGGIPSFMKVESELFKDWSESLEEE